jgi:N-sulfoglucosamine sulfohydrolase
VQELWFKAPRPVEEFYDVDRDPHEVSNLIDNPAYKKEIERLRKAYNHWVKRYNALWKLPENELRELFWPHGIQPFVAKPKVIQTANKLVLKSSTKGASIAYQINGQGYYKEHWLLYTNPVELKKGDVISVVAVKAGYKNSDVVIYKAE